MRDRRDRVEIENAARDDDDAERAIPVGSYPRLAGPDDDDPKPNARRPRPDRRHLLILGVVTGIGAVLAAAWKFADFAADWLGDDPTYRLDFDRIELAPPPPPELKLDAPGLLAQVLERAGEDHPTWRDGLSSLNADKATLAGAIERSSPWIDHVGRIRTEYPNRIVADVAYRRPVAKTLATDRPPIVLDRRGEVLPTADLRPEAIESLVQIKGLTQGLETRPGRPLLPPASRSDADKLDAGLAMAAFLRDREGEREQARAARVLSMHLRDAPEILWLHSDGNGSASGQSTYVQWGRAPGREAPGELKAPEKWRQYLDWAGRGDRRADNLNRVLLFTPDGPRLSPPIPGTPRGGANSGS